MPPLVNKESSGTSISVHLPLLSILEYKPILVNVRSGESEDRSRFSQDLEILLSASNYNTKSLALQRRSTDALPLAIVAWVYPENFLRGCLKRDNSRGIEGIRLGYEMEPIVDTL